MALINLFAILGKILGWIILLSVGIPILIWIIVKIWWIILPLILLGFGAMLAGFDD